MKKVLSFILCITMILSLSSVTFAEHYSKFTDVKPDSWYYEDVDNAVRLGIINGKSETTYCPNDNLTYAEAYKLAACMHQLSVNGKVTLKNSDPWYAEYVEYCCINGIYGSYEDLSEDIDMNQKITRSGYMGIFANALPDDRLPVINYIPDGAIPDVSSQAKFAPGVYKLYRAGILQGSDDAHNCKPYDNIKRSEVAAILSRMMDKTKRVRFDMGTPEKTEPLVLVEQPKFESIDSGKRYAATVKVTGGKEPYNYTWQMMEEIWYNISTLITMEPEISMLFTGYNKDTLTFNSFIEEDITIPFRCKVVDATVATPQRSRRSCFRATTAVPSILTAATASTKRSSIASSSAATPPTAGAISTPSLRQPPPSGRSLITFRISAPTKR